MYQGHAFGRAQHCRQPAVRSPHRPCTPSQSTETPLESPHSVATTFLAGSQSSLLSLQPLSRPALLAVGDGGDFYGFGRSGTPEGAVGSLGCRRAELNPWEGLSGVLPPCPVGPWVLPMLSASSFWASSGPVAVGAERFGVSTVPPGCHLPEAGALGAGHPPLAGACVASATSLEAAVPRGTKEHPPGIPCPGAGVRCPERRGSRRCRCPATSPVI